MQIFKFNHILKPILWGGDRLTAFKGLSPAGEPIGESWELSAMPGRESVVAEGEDRGLTLSQLVKRYGADLVGEDVYRRYGDHFPLLIKLIDAKRDLSVQVHPCDDMAMKHHGCKGKNEMWYVLEAEEGAVIRTGFNRKLSPEEFDQRLCDGTILDVVNAFHSKPGDTFYIPAGQIHTIGAGNLLAEIQQSCDITYRVWDYNRRDADGNLRQLHIDLAREALDFSARECQVRVEQPKSQGLTCLVNSPEFDVRRLAFEDGYTLECAEPHSFAAVICIHGETTLQAVDMPVVALRQGETALIPAILDRVEMTGAATLLMATI